MKSPKEKAKLLSYLLNLKTFRCNTSAFKYENALFEKACKKKALDKRIKRCKKCVGFNLVGATENAPGWGNLNANVFFVGQSLCTKCMQTQIPFTKGSGYLIDIALRLSGLLRKDVFFSNIVLCHPQHNRASSEIEIRNCAGYLREELQIVKPKLVVALGQDAKRSIKKHSLLKGLSAQYVSVKHPASFLYSSSGVRKWIIDLSEEIENVL